MKEIYLDYAAATPIDPRVLKAMNRASLLFANPSSFNDAGRKARAEIEKSRQVIARFLNAQPNEIIFTSSGSEANQLGLLAALSGFKKSTIITTPIEHTSVLETFKRLAFKIKKIKVDHTGTLDLGDFKKLLSPDCQLVSVMYANNEIGSIQPIKKIAKIISDFNKQNKTKILFHVDACQAALFLDMDVRGLGADILSFDGTKVYGPHGLGVLYVKKGASKNLKTGTENTQAIIGLAKAVSLIDHIKENKVAELRDYALEKLSKISGLIINGPVDKNRLPNNINVCLKGLESETLLLELDKYGIRAGSGSACTSHSVEPSHVLKAIGVASEYINGALRVSLGRNTTKKEIDYFVEKLYQIKKALEKRYQR